jgi:hypothetical protein
LLRAKEDRVADEKELMRIDGVAQSENIDGLVNSLTTTYPPRIYLDYSNNFNIF